MLPAAVARRPPSAAIFVTSVVVVVLPFVPVTPTTVMRPAGSPYHLAASFAAASCASGTSTQGTPSAACSVTTQTAPRAAASFA